MRCEWTPDQADFGEVLVNQKAKMKLKLTNHDSSDVKLEVVSEPTTEFVKKYKIKDDDLRPQQSTDIEIELQNGLPLGVFKTALTLQTQGDPKTRFTIPITGKIVDKLTPKVEIEKGQADNKAVMNPKAPVKNTATQNQSTIRQKTVKEDKKSSNSGSK